MKTHSMTKSLFLLILFNAFIFSAFAQETGNGNVVRKALDLPEFTKLSVGGALKVKLSQAPVCQVILEADENLIPLMEFKVSNGELKLNSGSFKKATVLQVEITLPEIESIEASGASQINASGAFQGSSLEINVSGASVVNFSGAFEVIEVELSGASKSTLVGTTSTLEAKLNGAAKLLAAELIANSAEIEASGAAKAEVNAVEHLEMKTSGAAKISHNENVQSVENEAENALQDFDFEMPSNGDTVKVDIGGINITVIDDDSVKIKIGNNHIIVDDNGNVKMNHEKCNKFNGHWSGVELGVNGLLTPDYNMSYPAGQEYLDLRMEKSINVNLNFFEQNIALNKAKTIGLVSGMGLSWNNYRFANPVYVATDSSDFAAFFMDGISVKKTKLTNMYLTVPLFFEFQTNGSKKSEELHFALGVVGGWRVVSHMKYFYNEANKDFTLRDPLTGNTLPVTLRSPDNYDRNIVKNFDSFNQRPLKLDASVRMGWGIVNLYANYSIFSLWIKDKGPEVYPFSAGICLSGW